MLNLYKPLLTPHHLPLLATPLQIQEFQDIWQSDCRVYGPKRLQIGEFKGFTYLNSNIGWTILSC